MTSPDTRRHPDWGHVVLVLLFAGFTALYLVDAWQASSRLRNLILILPAAILAFGLCALVLIGILRDAARPRPAAPAKVPANAPPDAPADAPAAPAPPETLLQRFRTGFTMALFALYILSIPYLGFDVGTALFVAANLLLDGERRPLVVIGIPVLFAVAATLCFRWLLPYPMPILLL